MLYNPILPAIAKHFSKAALAYNQHAKVQEQAAQYLLHWILESPQRWPLVLNDNSHILELGCGTGLLTQKLQKQWPWAHINACDISPHMLEIAQSNIKQSTQKNSKPKIAQNTEQDINNTIYWAKHKLNWILGDASQLTPAHPIDWIVSNFCMQWFDNIYLSLEHHLKHCRRISFSVPCQGSFVNWENAHTQLGLKAGLWPLPNHQEMIAWLQAKQLQNKLHFFRHTVKTHVLQFEQPLDFAQMLKGLGANTPRENHQPVPLRRILKHLPSPFETDYQVFYVDIVNG